MRMFILLLLVLITSVVTGLLIQHDPGYVLISYDLWTIESTLWFFILAIIILVTVILIATQGLNWLFSLYSLWTEWRQRYAHRRAYRQSIQGFILLAEGQWQKAEKHLIAGIKNNKDSLLNYLGAAICAQETTDLSKRDDYLRVAHLENRMADTAIAITQARLQLACGQHEQALALLDRIHRQQPHHEYVLKLLMTVYLQLKDWDGLLSTLAILQKKKFISIEQFHQLRQQAYLEKCRKLQHKKADYTLWLALWKLIPSEYYHLPAFLLLFIPVCMHSDPTYAEQLLCNALHAEWDDGLVTLYGLIPHKDIRHPLSMSETWLKQRPQNTNLLLSAARLCLQEKLWGKAEQYLNASIESNPSPEAYYELGKLYQALNEPEKGVTCFEKGLMLAVRH